MTTTLTTPDLSQQLAEARTKAARLREEFDRAEGELAQAAEALDYGRANTLKQRADELRPTVLLAENSVLAMERTAQALIDHAAEQHATQREKERQERAQAALVEHAAAERAALADCDSLLAQVREHIAAARDCLRTGLNAQNRVTAARVAAYQVEVDSGLREPSAFGMSAEANNVSAAIDASPVLSAVFRSTP